MLKLFIPLLNIKLLTNKRCFGRFGVTMPAATFLLHASSYSKPITKEQQYHIPVTCQVK